MSYLCHKKRQKTKSMTTDSKFSKADYGDWQTSHALALSVCRLLKRLGVRPQAIIEPTCGKGSFIMAALEVFDSIDDIYGVEINPEYLDRLRTALGSTKKKTRVHLINDNVFKVDFKAIKSQITGKNILVLGNPPWVTNSELGKSGVDNLPEKSNFKHFKGLSAMTGKGNFDIAENITLKMLRLLAGENGTLALLLKTSVIKNVIYEQRNHNVLTSARQYNIDTEREFQASAQAALFVAKAGQDGDGLCHVYDFYSGDYTRTFGWIDHHFVADSDKYEKVKAVDGKSSLTWWSGLKHDCSKVLELTKTDGHYYNKLNERVNVEDGIIYPFLKSSDLKGEKVETCRRYIILTQHKISDNTDNIKRYFPQAYKYLQEHASYFDARKSSIYKNRPRFCLFGIGDYTFKKYRIAISGLYKQTRFSLVSDIDNKRALLDDTTYLMGFDNPQYALWTLRLLNSQPVQTLMSALSFEDAKRPINKDLLMRIDLVTVLDAMGKEYLGISESQLEDYRRHLQPTVQTTLF